MKKAMFVLVGIALMILVAGCVSPSEKPEPLTGGDSGIGVGAFATPTPTQELTSTPIPTPTTTPAPTYVTCSEYHKVVDTWKTPSGFYVTVDNTTYYESSEQYSATKVGSYVIVHSESNVPAYNYCPEDPPSISRWGNGVCDVINAKPVSEAESGYRDACEVIS